jgi:membrane-bound metal-dependent hydrolase YbcI (DUF457 family)
MDNLAHTLVGVALGRAVGDGKIPAAGWIGAIAANAPDWTELVLTPRAVWPGSGAVYLAQHRGITHSFLGAAVEIAVLTLLVKAGATWWARRRGGSPPTWPWIAACIALTVLSHLYMDWQGSYGLRPLLPWSARWYYADWVAIVDPFFWLVPLVALAWGAPRRWPAALGYAGALCGVATLVLGAGRAIVVLWVRLAIVAFCVVCVVGWVHHWFGVAGRRRAAAYAVLALVGYAAVNAAAARVVQARVHAAAVRRFGPRAEWAALTQVGRPFEWEAIYASPDTVAGRDWALPRHLDHPAVRRAIGETPDARAMAGFARFLAADVDSAGGGLTIYLRDARYERRARRGWGVVAVRLR